MTKLMHPNAFLHFPHNILFSIYIVVSMGQMDAQWVNESDKIEAVTRTNAACSE